MYKKAGIVVCILIIGLAIAIYFIATAIAEGNKPADNSQSAAQTTVATSVATTAQVITQAPALVTTAPAETSQGITATEAPVVSDNPQEPVADTLTLIDENSLPTYTDVDDIGTVVGKKVYARNGAILTSLIISTTKCGQLEYFTSVKGYATAIDTMVNCKVRQFVTSTGGVFQAVINVEIVKN